MGKDYPASCRPLLSATWPELVRMRLAELCAAEPSSLAAAAAEQLKVSPTQRFISSFSRTSILNPLLFGVAQRRTSARV